MAKEKRGLSRLEGKAVDLYNEELKETLVEADSGSSGWNEERDIDSRLEDAEKKKGAPVARRKKGKRR